MLLHHFNCLASLDFSLLFPIRSDTFPHPRMFGLFVNVPFDELPTFLGTGLTRYGREKGALGAA
jgi:hypothetical protein